MLAVENMVKTFEGILAVDSISFRVGKGEIVGLIGPNGAGKSTILETISGFYAPTRGAILLEGKQIHGLKPHQVFKLGLTRSFQLAEFLPSFTVFDTILLPALYNAPLSEAHKRVERIIELLDLNSIAKRLVSSLVPAEQKRVEMGRILSCHPKIALLDEIMAGLTQFEATSILSIIRNLNEEGVTFLIVEHRLELLRELCNRIIAINFGRKIAEGSPREVMDNKEVIEAYIGKGA